MRRATPRRGRPRRAGCTSAPPPTVARRRARRIPGAPSPRSGTRRRPSCSTGRSSAACSRPSARACGRARRGRPGDRRAAPAPPRRRWRRSRRSRRRSCAAREQPRRRPRQDLVSRVLDQGAAHVRVGVTDVDVSRTRAVGGARNGADERRMLDVAGDLDELAGLNVRADVDGQLGEAVESVAPVTLEAARRRLGGSAQPGRRGSARRPRAGGLRP